MTYIIGKGCVDILDGSCVDVCPVDCIYSKPGDNQLFINPDECIDCAACEPVCPENAIFVEEDVPEDHEKWRTVENKLQYLSEKPGKGD